MLQKSYYHAWNPHEILHWMSYKNKNLKKNSFERMYFNQPTWPTFSRILNLNIPPLFIKRLLSSRTSPISRISNWNVYKLISKNSLYLHYLLKGYYRVILHRFSRISNWNVYKQSSKNSPVSLAMLTNVFTNFEFNYLQIFFVVKIE